MNPLQRFEKNEMGRDFIVGDIHGCFDRLTAALEKVGFDESKDRLFSVGDLVDRGPDSAGCLEWLAKPWFHAVQGNHELMAIEYAQGHWANDSYAHNGGAWFMALTKAERQPFIDAFESLPIAIELETEHGLIGIVHGECAADDWPKLMEGLEGEHAEQLKMACLWGRGRIQSGLDDPVSGVWLVVLGHTPLQEPKQLGNCLYIDTGAVFGRPLALFDVSALKVEAA